MVLVGIDWSEKWHDVCLMDEDGRVLGRRRIDDSPAGLTQLQALIAEHAADTAEVVIGIETPRGLMVQALRAAGYAIYAVTPWRPAAIGIDTLSRRRSPIAATP